MESEVVFEEDFDIEGGNFVNAGESSSKIKKLLKEIGIDTGIIRKLTIAAYEAEMNVVMYADNGKMKLFIYPEKIYLEIEDRGPGIDNIKKAMQPGFSTATDEIREMGFGAGMGLPNIKKNSDVFNITSRKNEGTKLEITINLDDKNG